MSVRDDVAERIPGGDAGLILAVLAATYVAYVLVGVGLGGAVAAGAEAVAAGSGVDLDGRTEPVAADARRDGETYRLRLDIEPS